MNLLELGKSLVFDPKDFILIDFCRIGPVMLRKDKLILIKDTSYKGSDGLWVSKCSVYLEGNVQCDIENISLEEFTKFFFTKRKE